MLHKSDRLAPPLFIKNQVIRFFGEKLGLFFGSRAPFFGNFIFASYFVLDALR